MVLVMHLYPIFYALLRMVLEAGKSMP